MKNNRLYLLCLVAIFFVSKSSAQTVIELSTLKAPLSAITVDASLKDWGDSLQYFSEDAGAHYGLTNDKDNLYFAIKLDDLAEAMRVLKAGITLGIDPKGKKKPSYNITFPINTQSGTVTKPLQSNSLEGISQADRDELHREIMTSLRGIKVEGFKDIESDMITTSNTYGIKTVIDYDAKGNLICEAAIPLKFFNADLKSKTEWTFDVKLNGISNQLPKGSDDSKMTGSFGGGGRGGQGGGMGGGRGGHGGRGGQGAGQNKLADSGDDHLTKTIEFTGKFNLAPAQ